MPALIEDPRAPAESALPGPDVATIPPGFTKRRVWVAPEVTSHAAVVLTATKLFLVPGHHPPRPEVVGAVRTGSDPAEVFGPLVTVVQLGAVRGVAHDLIENTVALDAAAGSGTTGAWTSRATVTFASAEPADALFAKLWRRLGDEFKLRPDRPPASLAVQAPLAALAGILLATALLAFGANAAADYGPATPGWLAPLRGIDWRLVATLGGIAAAVVQVWMYRRLTRPPVRLELVKGG
jgi:hypothetical protein